MTITQLRNATIIVHYNNEVILVDPMLAPQGAIPALKYLTSKRVRNPTAPLPSNADNLLNSVTACLITHCQKGHFDHLDRAATKWLRARQIPTYCAEKDAPFLTKKGLNVKPLSCSRSNPFFQGSIELIPCVHGDGIVGRLMEHGFGYLIKQANEPSLYITGDTLLTDDVRRCISLQQPDCIVLPAGGAQFDIGGPIIMGVDDVLEVGALSTGHIIANHLEALDHCPVTRQQLKAAVANQPWADRVHVPADGETISEIF